MRESSPHLPPTSARDRSFPGRVLVLESDRMIGKLVVEWLQMSGYQALCASDTATLLRLMSPGCAPGYEIMLADVPAPLGSARQTLRRLARSMPGTPIIAMSADVLASGSAASSSIARDLGVAAVLVKPFSQEALLDAIDRARSRSS